MSGSSLRAPGPSRQPSLASTASAVAAAASNPSSSSSSSSAQRLRRLIWDATIPILVSVECDEMPTVFLDRTIETHYMKAPRISYLPLVLQEVKNDLLSLMMDEATLRSIKEDDYCFVYEGTPLRWHWPIGFLYDYHTANTCPSSHRSNSPAMTSLTTAMRRLSTAPSIDNGSSSPAILEPTSSFAVQSSNRSNLPWRLTLRIGNAPLEKLHSSPGLDNCRTSFMSMLKEADFVRWGSTKRVTNLRKTEQDALWEGVVNHNFETYWSVASKIIPPMPTSESGNTSTTSSSNHPSRAPSVSTPTGNNGGDIGKLSVMQQPFNESQSSLNSAAPSESNVSVGEGSGTAASTIARIGYRSLPMRFHLVEGAPVVQEPVAPYTEDGRPTTLYSVLSALFPLLVPPTPTFSTQNAPPPPPLAYAVIQGIRVPFEAEIPWIGAALSSADGWISVCLHLLLEGEKL